MTSKVVRQKCRIKYLVQHKLYSPISTFSREYKSLEEARRMFEWQKHFSHIVFVFLYEVVERITTIEDDEGGKTETKKEIREKIDSFINPLLEH